MDRVTTSTGGTSNDVQLPENQDANHILQQARLAAVNGDRQKAYQLSLKATQVYPQNINAWLMRADLAQSAEETVICMNRVNNLNPNHPVGQQKTYMVVQNLVKMDPFLAYQKESDQLYQVQNRDALALFIPKQRAISAPYPDPGPKPLRAAYGWLSLALVGLMVAGLGAIIFAPLAVIAALWSNRKSLSRSDRLKSFIVILVAGVVWGGGIFLGWIFLRHFSGYRPG